MTTLPRALTLRDPAALIALAVVLVGGCGATESGEPIRSDEDTSPPVAAARAGGESVYPETYRALGLPELPEATVVSTGRQTTSLRDGLSIQLTTSSSVREVRDYYRDALTALGWTNEGGPDRGVDLPAAGLTFSRDGLTYRATLLGLPSGTQVSISLIDGT